VTKIIIYIFVIIKITLHFIRN